MERLRFYLSRLCNTACVIYSLNYNFVIYKVHQQLNGHEFEKTAGDSGRQGSLACCSPCGLKMSGTI